MAVQVAVMGTDYTRHGRAFRDTEFFFPATGTAKALRDFTHEELLETIEEMARDMAEIRLKVEGLTNHPGVSGTLAGAALKAVAEAATGLKLLKGRG